MKRVVFVAALLSSAVAFAEAPQARLTLHWENDGNYGKFVNSTDRHYTAGVGASLTLKADFIDAIGNNVPDLFREHKAPQYAGGAVGSLSMFTPTDIANPAPQPDDRPWAGYSYLGLFLQRASRFDSGFSGVFESWQVNLGVVGPSSLGQNAQEMIHDTFDQIYPRGWDNQLSDEFQIDFVYRRIWRYELSLGRDTGMKFQLLPEVGFTLGTLMREINYGGTLRFGWLPDDFGPGRMALQPDFTRPVREHFAGYAFVRPTGRYVQHNVLLEGLNWRHNDVTTVDKKEFVATLEFGVAVHFLDRWTLSYSQVYSTEEFNGQKNCDSFGQFSLSYQFSF